MDNNQASLKSLEIEEKEAFCCSGMAMLCLNILLMLGSLVGIVWGGINEVFSLFVFSIIYLCVISPILFAGLKVVKPNEALVLTVFGKYNGTIKKDGYFFVNPFSVSVNPLRQPLINPDLIAMTQGKTTSDTSTSSTNSQKNSSKLSMKAMTLNNNKQKINDLLGNPIEVGIVVVWRIANTAKAVFCVDNFQTFISIQADSALRDVARRYPYDITDDGENENEKSLRGSSTEVAEMLRADLQERVRIAGLEVMEARITHLAYAPEIAAAMLQRQQASAIIAARQKIVEGAVGMVEMALENLSQKQICQLDEERKAQMVSNLLVVLCGNHDAQPIVNSGSIY